MSLRIHNKPVKLYWAGWETDTFKLGNEGWQISAEQDGYNQQIRIAINHPKAGVQGISRFGHYPFQEMMSNYNYVPEIPTMLRFDQLSREIFINTVERDIGFHPVDYRPRYVESRITSLNDYANFASIETAKNEIYLHEANINQILEMALNKQQPEQERIRKEMLKRQEIREMKMGRLHTELQLVV